MQFRRKDSLSKISYPNSKNSFAIGPVIFNFLAIVLLICIYDYIVYKHLFPFSINYIYWTINVLISYNIIAASARSYIPSIAAIALGVIALLAYTINIVLEVNGINLITFAESWQLIILGIIGFFIKMILK